MKKYLFSILLGIVVVPNVQSQSNCSNPTVIDICPSVILTGETNAGKGDDGVAPCNILGEDVVYKLNATNGAGKVHVSIQNSTGPMRVYLEEMSCGTGVCNARNVPGPNANLTFTTTNANYTSFYLWVDASTSITYDISFGADTGSVWINTPNLQGNFQFDTSICATPVFSASKPFFQVTYNSVPQTNPMTLAPLYTSGVMCIKTFLRNTTGLEGAKRFTFKFNPAGYSSVIGTPSIPGSYNLGDWITYSSGYTWIYPFVDQAFIGKGDFLLFPNTCLAYEFCFNLTPISNDPQLTNVEVSILGDGFGAPFSGYVTSGCCPIPFANCISIGSGSSSAATAIGFGFADPGGPLPVELTEFLAKVVGETVHLKWITVSEINNDYFTLQHSPNGTEWENVLYVDGAGNSNNEIVYNAIDKNPNPGITYYRLLQVDYDGKTKISETIMANMQKKESIKIYPCPAKDYIEISNGTNSELQISLVTLDGRKLNVKSINGSGTVKLLLTDIPKGMYFVFAESEGAVIHHEKIIVQ